jgi:hypothetical protein
LEQGSVWFGAALLFSMTALSFGFLTAKYLATGKVLRIYAAPRVTLLFCGPLDEAFCGFLIVNCLDYGLL